MHLSAYAIMNIKAPHLKLHSMPDVFTYGFSDTPSDLDQSLTLLSEALPLMVQLAQTEKSIELLAEEIERTRRRVNALEYVLIPNLTDTIKHITMRLAEMERSNLTRLVTSFINALARSHTIGMPEFLIDAPFFGLFRIFSPFYRSSFSGTLFPFSPFAKHP